jgi:hypothetical protein
MIILLVIIYLYKEGIAFFIGKYSEIIFACLFLKYNIRTIIVK